MATNIIASITTRIKKHICNAWRTYDDICSATVHVPGSAKLSKRMTLVWQIAAATPLLALLAGGIFAIGKLWLCTVDLLNCVFWNI